MNYNVTVIPGDGIGPEIVREARKVLDQVGKVFGHSFDYTEILMGGCSIDAYGVPLTEEALETARKSDAVLLGAVGGDVGNSRSTTRRTRRCFSTSPSARTTASSPSPSFCAAAWTRAPSATTRRSTCFSLIA